MIDDAARERMAQADEWERLKQALSDDAERIMARKRAIRAGGGTNRAARRKAAALNRPKAPRW